MIELKHFATASVPGAQTLCCALKYDDGTIDIIAAVHDARSGSKFVRVFPHEPNDQNILRANEWMSLGLQRAKPEPKLAGSGKA